MAEHDDDLAVRLAQFETLIERTGPPPSIQCTCDRCVAARPKTRSAA